MVTNWSQLLDSWAEPAWPGRIPSRQGHPSQPPHRSGITGDDGRLVYPRSEEMDRLLQGRQRRSQPRPEPVPRHRPAEDFSAWSKAHGELPRVKCMLHRSSSCTSCNMPIDYSAIRADPSASEADHEQLRIHSLLGQEHFIIPAPDDDLGEPEDLHPLGTLAAILGRSTFTIRDWERDGTIPASDHYTTGERGVGVGKGRKRRYTSAQLRGIRLIAEQEGIIVPGEQDNAINTRVRVSETDFTIRAHELFQHLADQEKHS